MATPMLEFSSGRIGGLLGARGPVLTGWAVMKNRSMGRWKGVERSQPLSDWQHRGVAARSVPFMSPGTMARVRDLNPCWGWAVL